MGWVSSPEHFYQLYWLFSLPESLLAAPGITSHIQLL